jgi:hypothetical protein
MRDYDSGSPSDRASRIRSASAQDISMNP